MNFLLSRFSSLLEINDPRGELNLLQINLISNKMPDELKATRNFETRLKVLSLNSQLIR